MERVFLSELSRLCEIALVAFSDLKQLIEEPQLPKIPEIMHNLTEEQHKERMSAFAKRKAYINNRGIRYWIYLHTIFSMSANISKIFWPPKEYSQRGIELRSMFGIDEKSIFQDRKIRNHSEHYDERIHIWAEKSKGGLFKHNIGLPIPDNGNPYQDMFNFDPRKYTVSFWGEKYEIIPIVGEIKSLSLKVYQKSSTQI